MIYHRCCVFENDFSILCLFGGEKLFSQENGEKVEKVDLDNLGIVTKAILRFSTFDFLRSAKGFPGIDD